MCIVSPVQRAKDICFIKVNVVIVTMNSEGART